MFKIVIYCSLAVFISLPASTSYYTERPEILNVTPRAHARDGSWEKLKEGHVEAIAQILGMYQERQVFFLARDSELLYDLAKIFSSINGNEKDLKRIHLINVSRLCTRSKYLKEYLAQEGLTQQLLETGEKVILVDTGYSGTIPLAIQALYPEELRNQIQTHLMCSINVCHPSSRVFLKSLNPIAAQVYPGSLHGTLVEYELRPRYTDRANEYHQLGCTWVPYSPNDGTTSDGQVSTTEALKDMEDLKAYALTKDAQDLFQKRLHFWSSLNRYLAEQNDHKVIALLDDEKLGKDPKHDALVRDAIEVVSKNFPEWQRAMPLLRDFGLHEIDEEQTVGMSKLELIKKFPSWKPFVEDPKTGVAKLINARDFHTIRSISDVINDAEWFKMLSVEFGKRQTDPMIAKEMQATTKALLANRNQEIMGALIKNTFSSPATEHWNNEFEFLVSELNDMRFFNDLAHVFTLPHASNWGAHLTLLIERQLPYMTLPLIGVFCSKNGDNWKEQFELLMTNFGEDTFHIFDCIFPNDSCGRFLPQLEMMIKLSDRRVLCNLYYVFLQPGYQNAHEQLALLITLSPSRHHKEIVKLFMNPQMKNFKDEFRLLIEKSSKAVHLEILTDIYDKSVSKEFTRELVCLLTNVDEEERIYLLKEIESRFRFRLATTDEKLILFRVVILEALKISDVDQRKRYLVNQLGDAEPFERVIIPPFLKIDNKSAQDLSSAQKIIEDSMSTGNVQEKFVILDVDDTLVLYPEEDDYNTVTDWTQYQYKERAGATDLLTYLYQEKLPFLISSTHPYFDETLKKLRDIQAFSFLDMDPKNSLTMPDLVPLELFLYGIGEKKHKDVSVEKIEFGRVVSARIKGRSYFMKKAFSLMSLTNEERAQIIHLFLVDDSVNSIRPFVKDIQELAPTYLPALERVTIVRLEKTVQ